MKILEKDISQLCIGLIAGGQLAKMIIEETSKWSIRFHVLDPQENCPACGLAHFSSVGDYTSFEDVYRFGQSVDLLTYELENINTQALEKLKEEGVPVFPDPAVLKIFQDKLTQKKYYQNLGLPSSPFLEVYNQNEILQKVENGEIRLPFIWKARKGGYDGRGVQKLASKEEIQNLPDVPAILEETINIDKELALIVVRNAKDEIVFYDPVEMVFDNKAHLVEEILSPARIPEDIKMQMQNMATSLVRSLNYQGVLAIEFFLDKNKRLFINESAPRPHNSGHVTIENAVTSQFEQHIRAILGLPLGSARTLFPAGMFNLLGPAGYRGKACLEGFPELLEMEGIYLHLYGKEESRPYRKMGHVTVTGKDHAEVIQKLEQVKQILKIIPCKTH